MQAVVISVRLASDRAVNEGRHQIASFSWAFVSRTFCLPAFRFVRFVVQTLPDFLSKARSKACVGTRSSARRRGRGSRRC